MPAWLYLLRQVNRRLWLSAALYSLLGVAAALLAAAFEEYVPPDFPLKLGSDSVDDILTILASSMLAVATFSLTTLVTAYTAVGASAAPRAAELLVSDRGVRGALATFVGAFIYAMVGIVALHTGYYGAQGRVILFFVTLVVLLLVVVAMLRWIGQLSDLGQTGDAIDRVARSTAEALRSAVVRRAWRDGETAPQDARAVVADRTGFVQNIDLKGLDKLSRTAGGVWCVALPGDFVHAGGALLRVRDCDASDESLREKVTVGTRRSFDQDPRYGLAVLGEIAARALSPAVNDPGTAKAVAAAVVQALDAWAREEPETGDSDRGSTRVAPLAAADLLRPAFDAVSRHAAAEFSLQAEVQTLLAALRAGPDRRLAKAAEAEAARALAAAQRVLTDPEEREALARSHAAGGAGAAG
jgi:uncharacterized membrane protein